jgi:hypothetical protein
MSLSFEPSVQVYVDRMNVLGSPSYTSTCVVSWKSSHPFEASIEMIPVLEAPLAQYTVCH